LVLAGYEHVRLLRPDTLEDAMTPEAQNAIERLNDYSNSNLSSYQDAAKIVADTLIAAEIENAELREENKRLRKIITDIRNKEFFDNHPLYPIVQNKIEFDLQTQAMLGKSP
jgi:hypothetical protein